MSSAELRRNNRRARASSCVSTKLDVDLSSCFDEDVSSFDFDDLPRFDCIGNDNDSTVVDLAEAVERLDVAVVVASDAEFDRRNREAGDCAFAVSSTSSSSSWTFSAAAIRDDRRGVAGVAGGDTSFFSFCFRFIFCSFLSFSNLSASIRSSASSRAFFA